MQGARRGGRRGAGRAGICWLAVLLAGMGSASGESEPPASSRGWNPSAAAKYSSRTGGAVLVISQNGRVIQEACRPGFTTATPLPVFSITKSIVALACLADGRTALDGGLSTTRAGRPTLRELLGQTSGISPGYRELYGRGVTDIRRTAAGLPRESEAGERFCYGPSHYELLGTIPGLFGPGRPNPPTRLLARLGIHPANWRTDAKGQIYLSAGAVLSAKDLLRLGEFVLSGGRGPGIFPLIRREKFLEALRGSPANPSYGLGFWLNASAAPGARERDVEEAIRAGLSREDWRGTCLSRRAPPDLICMAGSGGQRVYVVPSRKLVVVRLGRPGGFRDPEFLKALFSRG